MPTDAEWTELFEDCTWEWTQMDGIDGRKVTGPNGNSIFFPAAGLRSGSDLNYAGTNGQSWSSTLYYNESFRAWSMGFDSGNVSENVFFRCRGRSVRPVCD